MDHEYNDTKRKTDRNNNHGIFGIIHNYHNKYYKYNDTTRHKDRKIQIKWLIWYNTQKYI
jgi:hypothetical protein